MWQAAVPAAINAVTSLFGGSKSDKSARRAAEQNAAMQREFAQNGIRWKVADAKAAGVHPLYALGAQTHSFSPVYTGDTGTPNAIANMGQDISRAMMAKQTNSERLQERLLLAQIKGQEIDNAAKASTVARGFTSSQLPPPLPGINFRDSDTIASSYINRGVEAAVTPANKIFVGYDGRPVLSPSPEYANSLEGNYPVGQIQNFFHNTVPWYQDRATMWVKDRLPKRRHPRTTNHDGYTKIHW